MELKKVLRLTASVWLALFVPLETWVSWPALYDPYYLVSAVGMSGMGWGLKLAWSDHPRAPAVLAAAWAWTAADFWRGTADRFEMHAAGETLRFGPSERWMGVALTAFLMAMTGLALRAALSGRGSGAA